jgi:hypothetical protein
MGFFDALLGRTKPKPARLDALFAVPQVTIGIEASLGMIPTGVGSVAFKTADGMAMDNVRNEVEALLKGQAEVSEDRYGYAWLVVRHPDRDVAALVTDLHAANTTLEERGFGSLLLCTMIGFESGPKDVYGPRSLGLVYLYKQGSWYPFAPTGGHTRDSNLEIQVKQVVGVDLPWEPDLTRWFALWGAPGL